MSVVPASHDGASEVIEGERVRSGAGAELDGTMQPPPSLAREGRERVRIRLSAYFEREGR